MTERQILSLPRLRALSAVVLLGVAVLSVVGFFVTRNVVSDQEHKLLQQRTEEAALYVGSLGNSIQTQLASLAATAAATDQGKAQFEESTKLLTSVPGGFKSVALISVRPQLHVIAHTGDLPANLGSVRTAAVQQAVTKVGLTGALVGTPAFMQGDVRIIGFAYSSPTLADAVVYAESPLQPASDSSATQGQPFGELIAVLYASPNASDEQLIAANVDAADLPLSGDVAHATSPIGAGDPWLLIAKARHPLVGSVATSMPWIILAAGLLAAVLATGVVEILGRRREYAMRLVDDRTEELRRSLDELADAHEQLLRQERLAAIGQLASSIGHELRNPLGVINNAMYLLRRDFGPAPGEAAQRHLATAEREISAATVIVSDLLEFARQREPVLADVDIVGLVDEVLSVLPPPVGINVVRDLPDAPVVIPVDRDMLRQVLLNLVGNGYQAMADGGELTVRLARRDGAAEVTVTDNGVGMDDTVRDRLFEPFFTTKARGIGLGLAVSKRIVDSHSGALTVESQPGAGATFHVVLPVIAAPRPSVETTTEAEVAG